MISRDYLCNNKHSLRLFPRCMKELSELEYQDLIKNARILERDRAGGKVFLTKDDFILKCFRSKKLFSSSVIWPYAERFKKNSEQLKQMGFCSVNVTETYFIPQQARYAVSYPRLPGKTIRQALSDNPTDLKPIESMAAFIASLHNQGIYFRSLHFGNILYLDDGQYALIDVVDTHFQKSSLNLAKRVRNFKHLARYQTDIDNICHYGNEVFLSSYLQSSELCNVSKFLFRKIYAKLIRPSAHLS